MGCSGFTWQSLAWSLAKIGIVGAVKTKAIRNITNEVLTASRWIWFKHVCDLEWKKSMEGVDPEKFATEHQVAKKHKRLNPDSGGEGKCTQIVAKVTGIFLKKNLHCFYSRESFNYIKLGKFVTSIDILIETKKTRSLIGDFWQLK